MARLEVSYFSDALGKAQKAVVLVPEKLNGPAQALLQLHGLSDDETAWTRQTSIERYVSGLNLIVVMPDGGRGFYCDAVAGYAYAKAIGTELVGLIEKWFPVKKEWAVGGLSMGGYGAMRFALSQPEKFVSAVSHSGALGFGRYLHREDDAFSVEMARVLGPDSKGGPNDLFALAQKAKPWPKLRIDCGTEDFLLNSNREFHSFLSEKNMAHEYEEFSGDHNWAYWDLHIQQAIKFHQKNLGF